MENKIRILHVLHSFSAGGLENGVVNIINGSPEHLEHELCLLTGGRDFLSRLRRPVRCHELHKRRGNDLKALGRLCGLLRRGKYDIIHTRNWAAFDGVLAACTNLSATVIHGEHGRDMLDPQGMNRRRNLLRRIAGCRVRKFVAVSSDLYQWLYRTVGIAENKIQLIRNGVDTEKFRPLRDRTLRRELGIGDDEFVVGTVARLDPVKDHEGMIESVRFLNEAGNTARLVIVGEGPNRAGLEKRIRGWHDGPPPILAGYREDTLRFYGIFDLFLLTSHAEGMSNTLLEAMACGLPSICTPVGANTEMVQHGGNGFLVPVSSPRDLALQIMKYRESSALRLQHGENARTFVEDNFPLAGMIISYINLYQSMGPCATSC